MKKLIVCICLIASAILFVFSFQRYCSIHKFNIDAVKQNITFLSSDNFKGRIGGSFENDEAANYIKDQFKSSNLIKYNSNYYQTFKAYYPKKVPGDPYLKVVDTHGNVIKNYAYEKDFKEDMVNFKTNHFVFYNGSNIKSNSSCIQVTNKNDNFIIYSPKDNNINFRSSFIADCDYSLCLMATKNCLSEIKSYLSKGCIVDCFIPYTNDTTTLKNVIGYIKGKNSSNPPIIISAHFDHMGTDLNGKVYSGALDNASGTSFILEMSKFISSLGTPNRDIIFVAFNGEEFGLKGSEAFVNKYYTKIKGGKDYNFDMIGSSSSVPLSIMGGKKDTAKSQTINSISALCAKEHVNFNYIFEDSSDHSSFRNKNIEAITFCDDDTSRIHTPADKAAYISSNSIDRCFKIVSKDIINNSYNFSFLILYNKQVCILSLFSMIIFTLILLQYMIRRKKNKDIAK